MLSEFLWGGNAAKEWVNVWCETDANAKESCNFAIAEDMGTPKITTSPRESAGKVL